jgi:hypothetical protein
MTPCPVCARIGHPCLGCAPPPPSPDEVHYNISICPECGRRLVPRRDGKGRRCTNEECYHVVVRFR